MRAPDLKVLTKIKAHSRQCLRLDLGRAPMSASLSREATWGLPSTVFGTSTGGFSSVRLSSYRPRPDECGWCAGSGGDAARASSISDFRCKFSLVKSVS